MSLLQKTDVYQGREESAVRKHSEYGFVLAIICAAAAIVIASVMFTQAFVGGELLGPYVGP
jgi:predicted N-acetyltransferase YhbS